MYACKNTTYTYGIYAQTYLTFINIYNPYIFKSLEVLAYTIVGAG